MHDAAFYTDISKLSSFVVVAESIDCTFCYIGPMLGSSGTIIRCCIDYGSPSTMDSPRGLYLSL